MTQITEQYDAFPYPERDPADERARLITGSPSHPLELDHFCFQGQRDWSQPFRALVAGGGTGDGLIQLAQVLASAGRSAEITYLDLSTSARAVAEARSKVRGLSNIWFETGSLLDAAQYGQFDYIDCCGVLHHLPEPQDGFRALRAALAPGGAMGMMVYAPHGRSGVYPLQDAFGALFQGLSPQDRLARAKTLLARLPDSHPFKRNALLSDHTTSEAGFYDLLLHSQDRAYSVSDLLDTLSDTGWRLLSFVPPALYDPMRLTDVRENMPPQARMAVAEQLLGTMRMHIAYVAPDGSTNTVAKPTPTQVPHLRGVGAQPLSRAVASGRAVPVNHAVDKASLTLPKDIAPALALIDGRRTLQEIQQGARIEPFRFNTLWAEVDRALCGWGLMLYSRLMRVR